MSEQNQITPERTDRSQKELTLEEAFEEIEAVLKHMEQPDLSLSDALAEYERGVALLKHCNDEIDRVEKQMIVLRAGAPSAEEQGE